MAAMKYAAHLQPEELILTPAQEWAPNLNGWHFLQSNRGQAYWLCESAVVDLAPGELLILSPSRQGVLRASQLGTVYLHVFRFCPEQLISLLTLAERRHLEQTALKPRVVPAKLNVDHPAARLMTEICARDPLVDGLELRAMLLRVVSLSFAWDLPQGLVPAGAYLPASKRIQVLMTQLTETELTECSPAELADRCGCSAPHFQRLFLNYFGVSFQARQTELRLIKAKELLTDNNAAIKDIADRSGFKQFSHFCRLFKKEFGVTPSAYRRSQARVSNLTDK